MIIPPNAIAHITDTWPNGEPRSSDYFLEDQKVGYRQWNEAGQLIMEYATHGERMHGPFCTWHDNGVLGEEANYIDGKEHGQSKHYDWEGNLLGTYHLEHGTGLDLWYEAPGILAEERHMKNGDRHGYERWWNGDNQTITAESHYAEGLEHGIFREWAIDGQLEAGFPQFFVRGQAVSQSDYLAAAATDASLPPYQPIEDNWARSLPPLPLLEAETPDLS